MEFSGSIWLSGGEALTKQWQTVVTGRVQEGMMVFPDGPNCLKTRTWTQAIFRSSGK